MNSKWGIDSSVLRRARVLLATIGLVALPAVAQQPPPVETSTGGAVLEEVVVTGSRISLPNMTSTSPIQVITAKDIQVSGRLDASDVILQLPQNFNNSFADFNNRTSALTTAGGLATADLRGLGPQRTLVLVNGRRLSAGDPNTANPNPAADLDQIPTSLIERVDVVTGGASSVYGSDAIAGVVNFILKRNFEGFQVDAQAGQNWHSQHSSQVADFQTASGYAPPTGSIRDGTNKTVSVVLGSSIADGRGNVTGYFSYLRADPVPSGNRDFGGCQLNAAADPVTGNYNGAFCFGSSNSNLFAINNVRYSVLGNQFVPWHTVPTTPPAIFNSQPYIYNGRDDLRYNAGFLAHVDLNEHIKPYAELSFMDDRTDQKIAPSALFRGSNPLDPTNNGNYNINCSNPLLSAQQAAILCTPAQIAADAANPGSVSANVEIGRRNIEGGGRESYYEHTNYRAVLGGKGDINPVWSYDAYGQYDYTTFFNSNQQYLNFQAIDNALQVMNGPNGPQCISGSPCVPYNIFQDGGVTPAQLAYLYLNGTAYGTTAQRTVHADITGDLGKYGIRSPWATNGLSLNVGYEHRSELWSYQPDSGEVSGLLSGFGGAASPIHKGYSVDEEFLEFGGAIVQEAPGVKSLVFDTGYRHSDYTTSGSVGTGKFELQYEPTSDVRFRASWQRATRAPNLIELYNPPVVGLIASGDDPCAPNEITNKIAATLQQCMRTGVTAAQYNAGSIPQGSASQLSQLISGNSNLKPERAKSLSLGATISPRAMPNFTASVDYYRIDITDEIGAIPGGQLLQGCLNTGDPFFCSKIVRSPANGGLVGNSLATLGYIDQTALNIGGIKVDGVDFQGAYKWKLGGMGALTFSFNGALLLSSVTTPFPGSPTYDCAGLFGAICQTVDPRWRHTLRTTWATPWDVDLSLNWRYIGAVSLDNNDSNPLLFGRTFVNQVTGGPGVDYFNARIPAYNYLDFSAVWNVTAGFTVRAGINNLLDKDPPIVTSEIVAGGANNTFETYDTLGRQLFVSFTAKF